MKIKNDHLYRKMCTFWFNEKHMVMFMDNTSRMAFLEIDENNKFHYPELRDVLALTDILHEKPVGVYNLIYDNNRKEVKKFKFIPKVKMAGIVTLLSASILVGCGKTEAPTRSALDDPQPGTIAWGMKYGSDYTPSATSTSTTENTTVEETNENEQTSPSILGTGASTEHWNEETDPNAQKYLTLLSPADDEYDYKWANDYVASEAIGYVYARDSKPYEEIFGFSKPTEQDLYTVLESNNNISPKYKEFIRNFIHDYLTLYPETDFSVLKYNLQTLVVDEMTEKEIQMKAMSIGTVACYLNNENTICIREDNTAMDKTTDDYVVLAHELMHACRICKSKDINGRQVSIKFYEDNDMGLYEDEALITYFAYQLQGMGNKPIYYTFQSNIYRQILEGMDYDGADYMNHSVNYFIEKLQEKFDKEGITIPAYHFVNLVDSHACTHYKDYIEVDYNNFEDLYKTLTENYAATHLNSNMTYEETEQAWGEFWDDIYFHVAELSTPYTDLNQDCFRPYWDQAVQNLGISSALQR